MEPSSNQSLPPLLGEGNPLKLQQQLTKLQGQIVLEKVSPVKWSKMEM